jgi:hypothetical protein
MFVDAKFGIAGSGLSALSGDASGKGGRKAGQNGNLHPRTGRDLKYADVTIWFVDAETIAVTSYERNYNSFHTKRRVKVS